MRSGTRSRAVVAPTRTAKLDHAPLRPAVGDDHGARGRRAAATRRPPRSRTTCGSGRCRGAAAGRRAGPGCRCGTRARSWSKMKPDRPSKNLITTLPRTASQTTTSAICAVRSLPSTLPMKLRSVCVEQLRGALDPGVALALLLADRQQRDAGPVDAQHALGEDRAHLRVLGQVLGRRVRVGADVEQHERALGADHLDRERRPVDAAAGARGAGPRRPSRRRCGRRSRPRRPRRA